ncbi:FecR family protein [Draconibacterium halophilum]|uniref:FecR family protein n=1 Tax=Draconibacterium halophilum TaxID=2706887 RepID=A0A6C0RCX5_9BACT|nr:FecR domain-containing protein [Draconibacterium halophilum]QIA08344.1 FecR family protein [Draconibacterium halophilum]
MNSKYLKYSIEELLDDKDFIGWILRSDNNNKWIDFIKNHPDLKHRAQMASEIILLLKDSHEVLNEEDFLRIWIKIDQFNQLHKKKVRNLKFRRIFYWAATVIILISFSALSYYHLFEKEDRFIFMFNEEQVKNDEARIILPDGKEIALEKDKSTMVLNNSTLTINNDSVIDLPKKDVQISKNKLLNEVVLPYGKQTELLLADGTKVWLNAGSKFAFPSKFALDKREVYLEGEAYFEVINQNDQPFVVNVANLDIVVLGTHFNVSAYPEDGNVETVLLEGAVIVSNPKSLGFGQNHFRLKPFQRASFSKEKNEIKIIDEPDAANYIAWTNGWLQFQQENLIEVLDKLERFYDVNFHVAKELTSSKLITGKLDLKVSLEDVLMALADVSEIDYRIDGDNIIIEEKINKMKKR